MSSVLQSGLDIFPPGSAPIATAGDAIGGVIGDYVYVYTSVTRYGETTPSAESPVVTAVGSVDLQLDVQSTNNIIARRIYRRQALGSVFGFVATLADNITTEYTDILSDIELGPPPPTANMASTVTRLEGWNKFTRPVARSFENAVASGGTLDTATRLSSEFVFVTGNGGVRLPPINSSAIGGIVTVTNVSGNPLNIYPPSPTDTINAGVGGGYVTLANDFSLVFIANTATNYQFAQSLTAGVAGPPSGTAGGVLSGSYPNPTLAANGVASGIYGDSNTVPRITIGVDGRISTVSTMPINRSPNGLAGGALSGSYPNPALAATGVASGLYGSSSQVPIIQIGADGRVTSAMTTTVAGGAPGGPAGGDLVGTYPDPELGPTGVIAGTFTKLTVDEKGRVLFGTSLVNADLPLMEGNVTGNPGANIIQLVNELPVSTNEVLQNVLFTNSAITPTGSNNTAFGFEALNNIDDGISNTAFGQRTLQGSISGQRNTAIGRLVLSSGDIGSDNTACGESSGSGLISGAQNAFFGALSGSDSTSGSNLVCLGYNAQPSSGTATNEITIGNATHDRVRFAANTVIPQFADSTSALAGGLTSGMLYRTGGDPDLICLTP